MPDHRSMSDVLVSVGGCEQTSIDAGAITLDGLYQCGLSFHCEANGWSGKANGYCNTVGEGNIVDNSTIGNRR